MARRLHGMSLFVVLVVMTVTTAMPVNGADEGNCPTTGSPDGDALLQASSVLQASAVVVKATTADSGHRSDPDRSCDVSPTQCVTNSSCGASACNVLCEFNRQYFQCVPKGSTDSSLLGKRIVQPWLTMMNNHSRCTPLYPTLFVYTGTIGDICGTSDGATRLYTCPVGCTSVPQGVSPWCLQERTRDVCRNTTCSNRRLETHLSPTSDPEQGNKCSSTESQNWIAPYGCEMHGVPPHTVIPGTTNPCRITEGTPLGPRVGWQLVASSTHGVTAIMEVGMTSWTEKEVSMEATHAFGRDVSKGVSSKFKGGELELEATVTSEFSDLVGEAIASALEQSGLRTVTVECPDYFVSPSDDFHVANSRIENIWQFVANAGDITAKTDHFRCHQDGGIIKKPKCLPQLCIDEFCQNCLQIE